MLANLTEFGRTPLFTLEELSQAKVALALFPVSAFRAAARATQHVYETIAKDGSQSAAIPLMQTREELYDVSLSLSPADAQTTDACGCGACRVVSGRAACALWCARTGAGI